MAGEGLWSKAEKRAALNLTRYAETYQEADFQHYLTEIAVPVGDQQARLQLQLPSPDMNIVRTGACSGP